MSTASDRFAAGSHAFEQQDYLRALAEFQAAIDAGSVGPAVHYNVAVCHYRLGDYVRAEQAFRWLAREFPQMRALADYNLGLALTRQSRDTEARAAFQRAQRDGDPGVAALASTMLGRLGVVQGAPTGAWTRLIDLRLGHDDNVALIDAASLPAGRSADSPFSEVFAYFSGPLPRANRWGLDASAYLIAYPDVREFDQSGIQLAALYAWRQGLWNFDAGPRFSHATLDGEGFEQRFGAAFNVRRSLSSRLTLGFQLTYDDIDALDTPYAYVEGRLERVQFVVDRALESGRVSFDYQLERNDRAGPGVSADRNRYSIRYRRSLTPLWLGEFVYEYRLSEYGRLTTPREERRHQFGVQGMREFSSAWQLALQYRYADNDSSDTVYSYDRHRFSVGVTKLF